MNLKGFFFSPIGKSHERDLCLNTNFNVGNKCVCRISSKSKVVCIPRLYLTGSLLVEMHSCGLHVYDEGKVRDSIRSGQGHRGLIGVCQSISS